MHAGKWRLVDSRCANTTQGVVTGGGPSFHTIYNGISHSLINGCTRARAASQGGDYTDRHPWGKCGGVRVDYKICHRIIYSVCGYTDIVP